MKSSPFDYVATTVLLLVLTALSGGVAWLSSPWFLRWFGDYHVVAEVVVFLIVFGVVTAWATRIILKIRPIAAGTHSMDSTEFTVWKLVTVLGQFGQMALRPITPIFMQPLVFSLYGARVGKDLASGGTLDTLSMITIGDRVLIGTQALISGSFMHDGQLLFGPVRIGHGATIGVNAVVSPNTEVGDGATLMGGSYLMPGNRIPPGETWRGNPARRWVGGGAAVSRD